MVHHSPVRVGITVVIAEQVVALGGLVLQDLEGLVNG